MALQALLQRLRYYSDLGEKDEQALLQLGGIVRNFDRNTEIIAAGQSMSAMLVMCEFDPSYFHLDAFRMRFKHD